MPCVMVQHISAEITVCHHVVVSIIFCKDTVLFLAVFCCCFEYVYVYKRENYEIWWTFQIHMD